MPPDGGDDWPEPMPRAADVEHDARAQIEAETLSLRWPLFWLVVGALIAAWSLMGGRHDG